METTAYTLDGVSLTAGHGGTPTRVWNSSGSLDLRVYKYGSLTFTAPNAITKIELTGSTTTPFSNEDGGFDSKTSTWTGYAASVTLTATGTAKINTITVTYDEASLTPGVIDFESLPSTYTYWKFTNMQSQQPTANSQQPILPLIQAPIMALLVAKPQHPLPPKQK